jgi:hypothetical protein
MLKIKRTSSGYKLEDSGISSTYDANFNARTTKDMTAYVKDVKKFMTTFGKPLDNIPIDKMCDEYLRVARTENCKDKSKLALSRDDYLYYTFDVIYTLADKYILPKLIEADIDRYLPSYKNTYYCYTVAKRIEKYLEVDWGTFTKTKDFLWLTWRGLYQLNKSIQATPSVLNKSDSFIIYAFYDTAETYSEYVDIPMVEFDLLRKVIDTGFSKTSYGGI